MGGVADEERTPRSHGGPRRAGRRREPKVRAFNLNAWSTLVSKTPSLATLSNAHSPLLALLHSRRSSKLNGVTPLIASARVFGRKTGPHAEVARFVGMFCKPPSPPLPRLPLAVRVESEHGFQRGSREDAAFEDRVPRWRC